MRYAVKSAYPICRGSQAVCESSLNRGSHMQIAYIGFPRGHPTLQKE